jgi:Ala-tRNA(Pro) deacylase
MPLTPEALFSLLDAEGIPHRTVSHPPLHTVEESQALHGQLTGAHLTNLFLRDEKGAIFLLAALEDAEIRINRLHCQVGCKRLSFGKPDLLWDVLGVRPGSVTILGLLNESAAGIGFLMDRNILSFDEINAHPLVNEMTTTLPREPLFALFARRGHVARSVDLAATFVE